MTKTLEEIYGSSPDTSTHKSSTGEASHVEAEPLQVETVAEPGQQAENKGVNADAGTVPADAPGEPPFPDDDLPKDVAGIRAAVQDERRKRREYEAKVAEYEKRVAEHERTLAEERRQRQEWEQNARALYERDQRWQEIQRQQQKPDPVLEPEAALQHLQQQYQQTLAHELAQRDNAIFETLVEMSQEMMRAKHQDYDEVEAVFADEMERNPALRAALRNQAMPARFAYEYGKRIKLDREMGNDPDAYIQRKISEALAAHQAAMTQQPPQAPSVPTVPVASRPASPQSLARVPSVSPRAQPAFAGPPSLEEIYRQ